MRELCLVLILTALSASTLAAETPWWDADWRCRREVVFPEASAAGAFEVVLPTHGLGRADGGDVRVVTGEAVVPLAVYACGPGDSLRLVFERRGPAPHFIYWNNPGASKPEATIRAGCFLETRTYPGTIMNSLDEIRKAWAAAASQGARYVPNVHFAYNAPEHNKLLFHFL